MASKKILSTLSAGLVVASLAVSIGAGAPAAASDGHRTATHHVHKTYGSHRLYNYAGPERRSGGWLPGEADCNSIPQRSPAYVSLCAW